MFVCKKVHFGRCFIRYCSDLLHKSKLMCNGQTAFSRHIVWHCAVGCTALTYVVGWIVNLRQVRLECIAIDIYIRMGRGTFGNMLERILAVIMWNVGFNGVFMAKSIDFAWFKSKVMQKFNFFESFSSKHLQVKDFCTTFASAFENEQNLKQNELSSC